MDEDETFGVRRPALSESFVAIESGLTKDRTRNKAAILFLTLEFVFASICYFLGHYHQTKIAWFICGVMLLFSGTTQYNLARDVPTWGEYSKKVLSKFLCVPVSCFGIKLWVYELAALSPNTLNMMLSAIAIGGSWSSWTGHQADFEKRWQAVPVVGEAIGSAGIPLLLTIFLVLNFLGRLLLICLVDEPGGRVEAANLIFLENVYSDSNPAFRFLILPFSRLPILWFKVSLMALSMNSMSWTQQVSVTSAILLGFNGLIPIVKPTVCNFPGFDENKMFYVAALINACIISVIVIHCLGILYCDSHDFSLARRGCTEA